MGSDWHTAYPSVPPWTRRCSTPRCSPVAKSVDAVLGPAINARRRRRQAARRRHRRRLGNASIVLLNKERGVLPLSKQRNTLVIHVHVDHLFCERSERPVLSPLPYTTFRFSDIAVMHAAVVKTGATARTYTWQRVFTKVHVSRVTLAELHKYAADLWDEERCVDSGVCAVVVAPSNTAKHSKAVSPSFVVPKTPWSTGI